MADVIQESDHDAAAPAIADEAPILDIQGLHRHFPIRNPFGIRKGWLRALDGVSLSVAKGEIVGIVGESGCGKSTLGKAVMGLHPVTAGTVTFEGQDITARSASVDKAFRRHLQYSYQDPGASLDPRWKIGRSLQEPLIIHTDISKEERFALVRDMVRAVGLPDTHLDLYPHEISGGQQRRVGLARILTLQPKAIILDEPTSGLDVSVQATILRLLLDLKEQFELSYIFISHDLSVVRTICTRVAVMYLGRIVETGPTEEVFASPAHPYTRSLISAVPNVRGKRALQDFDLKGEPPDPSKCFPGCRFLSRCREAVQVCDSIDPVLTPCGERHSVACHLHDGVTENSTGG